MNMFTGIIQLFMVHLKKISLMSVKYTLLLEENIIPSPLPVQAFTMQNISGILQKSLIILSLKFEPMKMEIQGK